jgi:hypothetical protein
MIAVIILLHIACLAEAGDIVQKPIKENQQDIVGLVLIQGAGIQTSQYVPLIKQIQMACNCSLWVGIPQFPFDVVEPLVISDGITRILTAMRSQGMPSTAPVFLSGHSLGGALVQDYVSRDFGSKVVGQILMGSFLERKYQGKSYPISTLTIGGELDGLAHMTRIMESYYHYVLHPSANNSDIYFPVVLISGMSHMQFASGTPPLLVKERDLKPEITESEAHNAIGNVIAMFIEATLGDSHERSLLDQKVADTGLFFKPLIDAFEMEGYYYFKPPCYDNPPGPTCTAGSPWAQVAQTIMGGLKYDSIANIDAFHPVSQINPIHLPKILNNCSTYSQSCMLHTTTVSQCIYEIINAKLDTGFFATSASEIRTKLSSRQNIMEAAGMGKVDFNRTDSGSICKTINEQAYAWALNNTNENTLSRYKRLGEPLVFGDDKGPYDAGPLWIYMPLEYKRITDANGNMVTQIRSPMLRTPTDYFIKLSAGFHYCKLLSPARAMEWIYIDGLRLHDSLNNSTII